MTAEHGKSQRRGVTMVEILVATTVFSLFMAAAFGIFRSSQEGFESGHWRIQRQKEAQLFLLRLKEVMEKANHAYEVMPDGQTVRAGGIRPVYINGTWFNRVASSSNNGVMYFSISTPYKSAVPELGQPVSTGIWKGVGLECRGGKMRCYMTGVWNNFPTSVPGDVGSADLSKFVFGNTTGDFSISLSDVSAIGVFVQQASETVDLGRPEAFVTVEVTMTKPKSRTRVQISERMTAKMQDRAIAEFTATPPGSFSL